ncbi:DUF2267 domain-containing protein [Micromonospora sp. NBC_01699]|uniref:DUF2267 domain-containing protein n=1 Tax=Micromonospora sp. NBC_01699 TaxID=2975984 RepID=UPI002E2CC27E|nr:DUF2267 domain-containing protein [Micromonospora sp. NBC_01699]
MTYDDFIATVARRTGLTNEQATDLTFATLQTLADRISAGEAQDLADKVPTRLADPLRKPPSSEFADPFDLAEFLNRVRDRAGLDDPQSAPGVAAVFSTLREAVPDYEFDDMRSQLPTGIRQMTEPVNAPGPRG